MRTKSYAMLTLSGLLAVSLAYIVPVMADDMSNTPSMQSSNGNFNANNDGMNMQNQNNSGDNAYGNSDYSYNNNAANSNPNANVGADDDVSPDTATGDDDY